jgi:hypothetical protein
MKKKNVWIAESLYNEIKLSKENMEKNRSFKKKRVTMLEASDNMGQFLNMMRTNKYISGRSK